MPEHQEHGSNLTVETKIRLAEAFATYDTCLREGQEDLAESTLRVVVEEPQMQEARAFMTALRMRKAAAAKGLRIGV